MTKGTWLKIPTLGLLKLLWVVVVAKSLTSKTEIIIMKIIRNKASIHVDLSFTLIKIEEK